MGAWKGMEEAKPGVDEWSQHLGRGSVETAGGLSKGLGPGSQRVGSGEIEGHPGSELVSGSPAKGLPAGN